MGHKGREAGNEHGFFSGVLLLSASTLLVKVIGLASKIPLIAVLGAEGMGYFNSAYEIYALLCTLSTAGLPVALSVLISAAHARGDEIGIGRIYRCAVRLFLALGLIGSLAMLLFAKPIAYAIGNADADTSMMAIAPALLCICMASAVRGYFQGYHRMGPTAVSQLIEALGKLGFGVLFAVIAIRSGQRLSVAAAYAVFGITLGTVISALYLWIMKAVNGKRTRFSDHAQATQKGRASLVSLLRIAFPVTVSSAVLGVTRMVDMALILRRLGDIGTALSRANEIYGSYTTLALPVFSLIPALITPVALSLVPKLSAAIEGKTSEGQSRVVNDALRLTVLLAMPASMGISLYARPILSILFSGEPEAVAIAAPLLSVLGASVFFSCMITTTNAILQAYRKQNLPIVSTVIGAAVKIVGAYFLVGEPSVGIFGAPVSTFLCNVTVTVLNLWFIHGCVPRTERAGRLYFRPLVASLGAMLVSLLLYMPIARGTQSEVLGFLAALPTALIAYVLLSFLVGAVTKEDLNLLPCRHRRPKEKPTSS